MELRPHAPADRPALARLYAQAFPENERLPLGTLLADPYREVTVAADGVGLAGLVVTIALSEADAVLLEYLAVDAGRRSAGLGGTLLERVVSRAAGRRVLAELEPPAAGGDAERRARFYRRHGFTPAPWQRGYGMPGPDGRLVPLQLWETSGGEPPRDAPALVTELYTRAYAASGGPLLADVLRGTLRR